MTDDEFMEEFHKRFPWYDYSYLLRLMILWMDNASKHHTDDAHALNSKDTAHTLKVLSLLLNRVLEDNHNETVTRSFLDPKGINTMNYFLGEERTEAENELVKKSYQMAHNNRAYDMKYFSTLLARKIFTLWD